MARKLSKKAVKEVEKTQGKKASTAEIEQANILLNNPELMAQYGHDSSEVQATEGDPEEQPIIEVSQDEVKKALKTLLTGQNDVIASLYKKHEEYNQEFFEGRLSVPLITIDKLSNRTLGNYTEGTDQMEIRNHIRFNQNFIALNTPQRILETLRHEMIHQWQDEVLYAEKGSEIKPGQKRRPKDWRNTDFKAKAQDVGIPAIGAKCYGNPAKMPEPKSYNRKFICGCVASNGYPVTVWSTRGVFATCNICKKPFKEVQKGGKVIEVTMSHVEKPNTDAVLEAMKAKYRYFDRFEARRKKDDFVEALELGSEGTLTELEQGIYQKGHNMYDLGYRYWVAYNVAEEAQADGAHDVEEQKDEIKEEKPKKAKKKPSEDKKKVGKVIPFPTPDAEEPKGEEAVEITTLNQRVYSDKNPQDIIDLYQELGTTRKVAERLGVSQPTVMARAKKFGIDFKNGTFQSAE